MSAPCLQCGTDAERTSVRFAGNEVAGGYLCTKCFDEAWAEFEVRRSQFNAPIAAGVDRAEANRIMIDRMNNTQAKA